MIGPKNSDASLTMPMLNIELSEDERDYLMRHEGIEKFDPSQRFGMRNQSDESEEQAQENSDEEISFENVATGNSPMRGGKADTVAEITDQKWASMLMDPRAAAKEDIAAAKDMLATAGKDAAAKDTAAAMAVKVATGKEAEGLHRCGLARCRN